MISFFTGESSFEFQQSDLDDSANERFVMIASLAQSSIDERYDIG